MNPKYPVYIISKGRWDRALTAKVFAKMGVPYRIVVEPQEKRQYATVIDGRKLLVLPFSNLGQGSIPARNWVWEHSVKEGHARHWVVDDNIYAFYRLNRNTKIKITTPTVLRIMEDFVDRYENVALAGPNYLCFAKAMDCVPPYYLNDRVYSCILIKNDLPHRWRGRYNEDTDLSLRALKDKWVTVLFNAFLIDKSTTMKCKGGNTDELYQGDGRKLMAESLQAQHPDVTRVSIKFGRYQHHVDYRPFKGNMLIRKKDAATSRGVDDYGLKLVPKGKECVVGSKTSLAGIAD